MCLLPLLPAGGKHRIDRNGCALLPGCARSGRHPGNAHKPSLESTNCRRRPKRLTSAVWGFDVVTREAARRPGQLPKVPLHLREHSLRHDRRGLVEVQARDGPTVRDAHWQSVGPHDCQQANVSLESTRAQSPPLCEVPRRPKRLSQGCGQRTGRSSLVDLWQRFGEHCHNSVEQQVKFGND